VATGVFRRKFTCAAATLPAAGTGGTVVKVSRRCGFSADSRFDLLKFLGNA